MSFLCRLGRHKPRGIPRWNDGLYFATCERCGRDLVRTAFEGWRVPSGYRIVWSNRPPASRPDVALIREQSGVAPPSDVQGTSSEPAAEVPVHPPKAPPPSAKPPEPGTEPSVEPIAVDGDAPPVPASVTAGRLPIQDVLAHLHAQEAAERAREAPRAAAEAPAPKRRSTWDFMDDEPFEDDLVPVPALTRSPDSAPPPVSAPPVDRESDPVSRKAGGLPGWWRSVRPAVHNFFSGPAEPRPMLVIGLALGVAIAVALGLYWAGYPAPGPPGGGSEGSEMGEKPDPFAASAPFASPGVNREASDEVAYVAATLLVCRDAPGEGARRVRNLLRGKEVRVLGYDGAWASLAYGGGQCWAQAQYLSPVPPL